ncbi:MAG: SUF system NifU family Fe-S cluster assembly protein [Actinobacteria bacterium]|nr:SUF system NifU family Fe-S cluster assembly protein [Actinomycetota bacterium]
MELDSLYQEVILDHYKHPLNKGLSDTYGVQVHHVNPSCGDEITLNVTSEDGVIKSITWDGVGCSISQASVSIASDLLVNKSFAEANIILNEFTELMQSKGTKQGNPDVLDDAVALAGVSKFPARIKCALLGWMAFKDAAVRISTTTEGE